MGSKHLLSNQEMVSNVLEIMITHTCLFIWFWKGYDAVPLPVYLVLSILFSLIHQRIVSEWIHESAHFNILRKKTLNDTFTQVFLGFFLLNNIKSHRVSHFEHHRCDTFLTSSDPDTSLLGVESKKEFRKGFIQDVLGITAIRMLFDRKSLVSTKSSRILYVFVLVHFVFFVSLALINRFDIYLIYYFSLGCLYPVINRIRVYVQHAEILTDSSRAHATHSSRTLAVSLIGRVFVTSPLMQYHHEHHARPQIPYRQLRSMAKHDVNNINQFSRTHWQIISKLYKGLPK